MKKGENEMKKLMFCTLAVFLMAEITWGQDDFQTQAKRVFSSQVIESVKINKGEGEILFKEPAMMPSYFRTGDKINKVFAIESARLFRDVVELNGLKMTIPLKEKTYTMSISREAIEKFYGLQFSSMKGNLDSWRSKFIQKYDTKESRGKFAAKFVKSK
jgi:hypothetical protein